ncbi:MAG: hypothetical protein K2P33_11205 [Acutalibacter sp.]|nr:hypothetical protein [Acutalibacter sp.]
MAKYLLKRLLFGLVSVVIVVAIVMVLIYSLLSRQLVFQQDDTYHKLNNNQKTMYAMRKWQEYGYLDYVTFQDYMNDLNRKGEVDDATREEAVAIGRKAEDDSELTAEYVKKFTETYESQGFEVVRLNAVTARRKLASGGQQQLFATRDRPLAAPGGGGFFYARGPEGL